MGANYSDHCNTSNFIPANTADQRKWMARLPDHVPLTAISIPGTNRSASYKLRSSSNIHQSLDPTSSLCIGIRYFDLYLSLDQNSQFILCQKNFIIGDAFSSFVTPIVKFLEENKSEIVLCKVSDSYVLEGDSLFADAFQKEILNIVPAKNSWISPCFPQTIGQARGKIIFLRDFPDPKSRICPFINSALSKWEGSSLTYRNVWLNYKKNLIDAQSGIKEDLYITYLSRAPMIPATTANRVNYYLLEFLKSMPSSSRFGILALDFPGAKLVEQIIQSNSGLTTDVLDNAVPDDLVIEEEDD